MYQYNINFTGFITNGRTPAIYADNIEEAVDIARACGFEVVSYNEELKCITVSGRK